MTILDLILLSRDYIESQEGEVISFEDGQMAKIKNLKYLQLHGLIGPDAFRENLLVKTILDGNIDDVVSNLSQGPKKDSIIEMEEKISHKFNSLVESFINLRKSYFNEYKEDRKEFALAHREFAMFGSVMKSLNIKEDDMEKFTEKIVKEYIEKQTNSLNKAKEWIKKL